MEIEARRRLAESACQTLLDNFYARMHESDEMGNTYGTQWWRGRIAQLQDAISCIESSPDVMWILDGEDTNNS